MESPFRSPPGSQGARARTASTSSNGGSREQPVVNVQKLESIAPEFGSLLTDNKSSILVTPDGQPSPRKREEEKRREAGRGPRRRKRKVNPEVITIRIVIKGGAPVDTVVPAVTLGPQQSVLPAPPTNQDRLLHHDRLTTLLPRLPHRLPHHS